MVYPDTFEGFQIEDTKKWSEFKKLEVRRSRTYVQTLMLISILVQAKAIRGPRH